MRKTARLISIIVPVYNEADNIVKAHYEITKTIRGRKGYQFEIIFTDNHSEDSTFDILEDIATRDKNVKVLRFNRNYGFQRSLMAGYRIATGAAVIQIDCDLQDPPEMILDFLVLWEKGHDVVAGVRRKRLESQLLVWGRRLFYSLINKISEDNMMRDAGDFRLIDRSVLNRLLDLNEKEVYIRGLVSAFAINEIGIPYDRSAREYGKSKFPLRKLVRLASEGIFSMSLFPLHLVGYVSTAISMVTVMLAMYYLTAALFFGSSWPNGFATIVLLLLLGISLNAIFLTIIGKYVGRIYVQLQNRPTVIVEKSINLNSFSQRKIK
jgi:glycosyltransferase involved in cell wall biosynthesis